MKTSAERIRALRLKNHLTLDDVARHIGVGRQAVYKYEQGAVTNIPLDNLEKMATLFGATPAYLAGWNDEAPEIISRDDNYWIDDRNERKLIDTYRSLSPRGKDLLLDRSEELRILYGKKSESDSAQSV